MDDAIERAAAAVRGARALVITAGAGMGVDSGLPDFRGTEGFWNAYPAYRHLGLRFEQLANPTWFARDPALAWGFYGHRLALYRQTRPHEGFGMLLRWARARPDGYFVFTSNVDGHFQRAGFDPARVAEVHGAIERLQCTRSCGVGVYPADGVAVEVDPATFRAVGALPRCPQCGALARPNILMFGDSGWESDVWDAQEARLAAWLASLSAGAPAGLVVVECGAGHAVPTVRYFSENVVAHGGTLVRINPREPEVPAGAHVGVASSALVALRAIDARLA